MAMAAISSGGLVGRCGTRCAVETPLDVRIQGKGNFVKTPGADSVGATFVFLDLFETDADFVAQHGLTQTELSPARRVSSGRHENQLDLAFVCRFVPREAPSI